MLEVPAKTLVSLLLIWLQHALLILCLVAFLATIQIHLHPCECLAVLAKNPIKQIFGIIFAFCHPVITMHYLNRPQNCGALQKNIRHFMS